MISRDCEHVAGTLLKRHRFTSDQIEKIGSTERLHRDMHHSASLNPSYAVVLTALFADSRLFASLGFDCADYES